MKENKKWRKFQGTKLKKYKGLHPDRQPYNTFNKSDEITQQDRFKLTGRRSHIEKRSKGSLVGDRPHIILVEGPLTGDRPHRLERAPIGNRLHRLKGAPTRRPLQILVEGVLTGDRPHKILEKTATKRLQKNKKSTPGNRSH